MNIDFPKTIIDVYNAATPKYVIDETLLIECFVIKAKEANKASYGYDFFFRECKNRVDSLKNNIEWQLKGSINKDCQDINCFDAKFKDYSTKFYYSDLIKIEKAINQAEQELIQVTDNVSNQQQITIPDDTLKWLQETICKNGNGKAFIEICNGKLKWLQNKQNARVLLTHKAIKGDLSDNKAIEQAKTLFVYGDNNNLLELGKNDKRQENANTDELRKYLNGLKKPTT